MVRCVSDNLYLGNIFEGHIKLLDKPLVCNAETCDCPYYGLIHALGKPKVITRQPAKVLRILEQHVYPITTPILKAVRPFKLKK